MNFLRELKYTAISMIFTVEGMFWTVAYPIILSSLFFVIFSAINTRGISTAVNTGITETNPHRVIFNFIPIVHVIPMEQDAADAALREGSIQVFIADDLSIRTYKNGIAQTIIKNIVEQIKQTDALGIPITPSVYRKRFIDSKDEQNNSMMILFYSLLAMVSIYSMFGAISIPERMQANISKLAVRMSAAPIKRFRLYLSGVLFFVCFNLASNLLYIGYVMLVLKLNLITDFAVTIPLLIYANLFGTAFGLCIGSIPKLTENTKVMIGVFSSLFLSFLSGMMSVSVKTALDASVPILSKINPIALFTDTLYNTNILHEYDLAPLFFCVYSGFIALFLAIAFFNAREVQYDSL
ncbi:ABC transporter permease [uncultured Treponema sp.]|uniref:ABC transporter permease n=1 Tax=uncultured Treponema sp. TaxID=162155 RepID=UPI0028F0D1FA|nr:ABC transporter permease [uncultured Treponema sp.]